MRMPENPRIGLWGNYGFQIAFAPLGRWIGEPIPNHIVGKPLTQKLMEGTLKYHVGVVFYRQKPKREQLEGILILDSRGPITEAMWLYETWIKEEYDDDPRRKTEDGPGINASVSGISVPW